MESGTLPTDNRLPHSCAAGVRLGQQLRDNQLDAAIDAGLMEFVPCLACTTEVVAAVRETQQRLRLAWAARDRHLARNARLARQAETRAGKRRPTSEGEANTLPSAAAAALARARARAKGGEPK